MLEDAGRPDVVTTWHGHEPLDEALYYFVNLAGGRPSILVAAVGDDIRMFDAIAKALAD